MKTIYHIRCEGYDFFFDAKGKRLAHWQLNDANYRSEYMDRLMKAIGVQVDRVNWKDKRFKKQVVDILTEDGAITNEADIYDA